MATAATATDSLGYYAVLGLASDATPDHIRSAYRREARRWHPDRNSSPDAEARMARLNEAYDVLSDPDRRAAYERGAFVHTESEPPRPVAYPALVDFGTLRPGDRVTRTIRVANAGGLFSTIRVEPDCGTWFRVAAARGGSLDDVVVELDFEAFAPNGSTLVPGRQREQVRIFLDEEFVDVALELDVAGSRFSGRSAASSPGSAVHDPSVADAATSLLTQLAAIAEDRPFWIRLGLAFITGVLDPLGLVWLGAEHAPESLAILSLAAVALVLLTGFCAYRTRVFTRLDVASRAVQFLAAAVFFIGKASIVLAAIALAVVVLLVVLVVIVGLALVAAVFAVLAGTFNSN